jgi:uncharacterized lipoprotein YehR (DUF1307 family)
MKKFPLMLFAIVVLAFGLTACDDDNTQTKTTEKSVVNGTTVESTVTTDTRVDNDGNRSQEIERKTTVDPEGLMNQTTRTEETTTETTQE